MLYRLEVLFFFIVDYFCRPECKDSEKVLEAIERLQADSDRDVRYYAGRDEEVPYEGRGCSDDQTYMLRTTSRESFEDEMLGRSPLDGEFAEEQIEAKLLAVEPTDSNEETVTGIIVAGNVDEGFEEETGAESDEITGDENKAAEGSDDQAGEENGVNDGICEGISKESCTVEGPGEEEGAEKPGEEDVETQVAQLEEEPKNDEDHDTSIEHVETPEEI